MKIFTYQSAVIVPRPLEEVFEFFGSAVNLQRITPSWLNFQILTPLPIEMQPGTLIDYKLRVRGFPIRWRTHIQAWEPPYRFVDEQLRGPYRQWIHEHTFEAVEGGTLCRDHVRYAVWGGWLINQLMVRKDVEKIFAHRTRRLEEIFAMPHGDGHLAARG